MNLKYSYDTQNFFNFLVHKTKKYKAGLAQLVEQLICNHQVESSSPSAGTINSNIYTPGIYGTPSPLILSLNSETDEQLDNDRATIRIIKKIFI